MPLAGAWHVPPHPLPAADWRAGPLKNKEHGDRADTRLCCRRSGSAAGISTLPTMGPTAGTRRLSQAPLRGPIRHTARPDRGLSPNETAGQVAGDGQGATARFDIHPIPRGPSRRCLRSDATAGRYLAQRQVARRARREQTRRRPRPAPRADCKDGWLCRDARRTGSRCPARRSLSWPTRYKQPTGHLEPLCAHTPPRPSPSVPRRAGRQSFKSRCFLLYAGAVARALRVESRRGRTHARPRAIATVVTSSAPTPIPPPLS